MLEHNNFEVNFKNQIVKDGKLLKYTIFDVYLINKFSKFNVGDFDIANLLNLEIVYVKSILTSYSEDLTVLCNKWINQIILMAEIYDNFDDLELSNNILISKKNSLNIQYSDFLILIQDYFKGKEIGKLSNQYLLSEDLINNLVFRYFTGDFDDIEKLWLKKQDLIKIIQSKSKPKNRDYSSLFEVLKFKKPYSPLFKSSKFKYNNLKLISDDGVVSSTYTKLKLKLPEILDIYKQYLDGFTLYYLSHKYDVSEALIDRLLFRYVEGDFDEVIDIWKNRINGDEESLMNKGSVGSSISEEDNGEESLINGGEERSPIQNNFIETYTRVGASYRVFGWALKRNDLSILVPKSPYEQGCTAIIDGFKVKARINILTRLFFDKYNEEVVNHLTKLHDDDRNNMVNIKILLDKTDLDDEVSDIDCSNELVKLKELNRRLNKKIDVLEEKIRILTEESYE